MSGTTKLGCTGWLLIALTLAAPAHAHPPAKLGWKDAKETARFTLQHYYNWKAGYKRELRCRRETRRKVRCRVSWIVGDVSYKGRVTLRDYHSHRTDDTLVHYRIRLRKRDHYCQDTGGSDCVKRRHRSGILGGF